MCCIEQPGGVIELAIAITSIALLALLLLAVTVLERKQHRALHEQVPDADHHPSTVRSR